MSHHEKLCWRAKIIYSQKVHTHTYIKGQTSPPVTQLRLQFLNFIQESLLDFFQENGLSTGQEDMHHVHMVQNLAMENN